MLCYKRNKTLQDILWVVMISHHAIIGYFPLTACTCVLFLTYLYFTTFKNSAEYVPSNTPRHASVFPEISLRADQSQDGERSRVVWDVRLGGRGEDCLCVVLHKDWISNKIASTPCPLSPPSHNILQLLAPASSHKIHPT